MSNRLALTLNISAYVLWSLATLVFHQLSDIDNYLVLTLRVLSAAIFCFSFVLMFSSLRISILSLSYKEWTILFLSSALIASNWYLVILSISNNQLSSSSLGYFLAPFLSVLMLKRWMKEKISRTEFISLLICLVGGVVVLSQSLSGINPVIGVSIAVTFALYSSIKKLVPIAPLTTLTVETFIASFVAVLYLGLVVTTGGSPELSSIQWLWIAVLGALTTLPILFFIASVVHLQPFSVGVLQYLNPTFMFLIAVFIFNEQVSNITWLGFVILWSGIAFYLIHLVIEYGFSNRLRVVRNEQSME